MFNLWVNSLTKIACPVRVQILIVEGNKPWHEISTIAFAGFG
jgi:hypothetical protein